MPKNVEARLVDFGGGLNDGVAASQLDNNELTAIRNLYPFRNQLRRRPGRKRITSSALGKTFSGLFALKTSTGTWTLIVGADTGMYKVSGNALSALTGSVPSSTERWNFCQYKDVGYAVRPSFTGMKRFTSSGFTDAGIAAPTSAPTLSPASTGNIDAGQYLGVVTFLNLQTDCESNPSDANTVVCNLSAAGRIDWSAIPVSTNPQVNARRLYRTLPNQTGEYYLVATIEDNTTTTYTDNVAIDDLGEQVSFRNGTPPDQYLIDVKIWRERLWAINDRGLYFSEEYLPECFAESSLIEITPDDGHKIRALRAFGDKLVWAKTNSIGFIVGVGPEDFSVQVLDDRNGCIANKSLQVAENFMFWYSGQNVFMSDGSSVRVISNPKIRSVLDTIPESRKEYVQGAIYPRLGLYLLSVPTNGNVTNNDTLLVYNYREQNWSIWNYPTSEAPYTMGDFYDEQLEPRIYAAFYQSDIFDLTDSDQHDDDPQSAAAASTNIDTLFRTKALDFGQPGALHAVKRVEVLCPNLGTTATMNLYRDQEDSPSFTRNAPLYSDSSRRWKRVAFSGLDRKAYQTQIEVAYTGLPEPVFEGLIVEAVVWRWKEQPK